jgi:hypothetical protein
MIRRSCEQPWSDRGFHMIMGRDRAIVRSALIPRRCSAARFRRSMRPGGTVIAGFVFFRAVAVAFDAATRIRILRQCLFGSRFSPHPSGMKAGTWRPIKATTMRLNTCFNS